MGTRYRLPRSEALAPGTAPAGGEGQKFHLLAELGRGGMATVYLAVVRGPAGFNKLIVVKCLRPSLAAEPEFLEMFLAEARLAARINHPNAVQTNEIGFDGQFYYIVMEYIEGTSLENIVRKAGTSFPLAVHVHILMQALAGLHHAHELKDFEGQPLNVVHRDVSPHNIMVSYDGQVKLVDFGIAKAADSGGNTRTGVMKGKCAYMAAEQFGNHHVDRRADVFAAGVCLWQALANRKLWKGLSEADIFTRVSRGEIPSPTTVVDDLPGPLVDICMRALALRPEDRFATAADFLTALEDFVNRNPAFRVSNRDVTRFVSELFAEERATMQSKIDEQLRAVASSGASLVTFQGEGASGAFMSTTNTPAASSRKKTPRALIAVAAVLAIGAGGIIFAKTRAGATSSQTPGTQANVSVRVRPENAKIYFDDAPLTGNPATASFTRDGLSHRVRAEAPGFARKTELVVLDSSNVAVDLELDPENADAVGSTQTMATLNASPPGARLYLDGTPLPANPAVTKVPRDGKAHEVKAEAAGFLPKTQRITFDAPTASVTLALDKDPKAPKGAAAAAQARTGGTKHSDRGPDAPQGGPVATSTAANPTPLPTTSSTNKKKVLDQGDPWGN